MNIGCLGWGSLIWDPRDLPVRNGWQSDGPLLPVEFVRHLKKTNRLTLALVPGRPAVRVLWALLMVDDLHAAIVALAKREGAPKANIGSWSRTAEARGDFAALIGEWATARQLDAIVWTALTPKWNDENGQSPTIEQAVEYVRTQGPNSEAAKYIRLAPTQVDTDYRRRLLAELPWLASDSAT